MTVEEQASVRIFLGSLLRRLEVMIDELDQMNAFPGKLAVMEEVMEMRGIVSTLLQWNIEAIKKGDTPF